MKSPRDVARTWFEAVWNERRDELMEQLMAADAPGHVEGNELRGPAQFAEMRAMFLGAFPDLKLTVEDIAEDGENAIVRWSFAATHTGYAEALGLNPTNAAVNARGITWLIVRDGKIVEGWDAWNLGALMNTLQTAAASQ